MNTFISVIGLSVSIASALFVFRQVRLGRLTSLSAIIAVEQSLRDTPAAFRFHGISEADIASHGLTAGELAYLVANFTAGGIYHRAHNPDSNEPFPVGSYRRQMLQCPETRKAWPLIKKMLNETPYTQRLEATLRELESAEPQSATPPTKQ